MQNEKRKAIAEFQPVERTSGGLRSALFDEIDALRSGQSNPARARSLAMLANTALKSVQVEIEFQKYVSEVSKHDGSAKIGMLEMGKVNVTLVE